jgi:hypothetical protein
MRLSSGEVVAAGRRTRWTLGIAGSIALIGIVALAAVTLVPGTPPTQQLLPFVAPPNAAVCAALASPLAEPSASPSIAVPPRAEADPAAQDAATKVSCYLLAAVPALFPAGTTFADNPARPGSLALVARPGGMGGGELEVTATAMVTDAQGTGMLNFSVSRDPGFQLDEAQAHCNGPTRKATCRTGPQGEHIEIYDFGPEPSGAHGVTIYVYSGHTLVLAGTRNTAETQDAPPTRTDPPFSVNQLIALAVAPAIRLYP